MTPTTQSTPSIANPSGSKRDEEPNAFPEEQIPPQQPNKKTPHSDKTSTQPQKSRMSGTYRAKNRQRCGECPACLLPDCGQCVECKRKKKFGGDGSSRQACFQRRCTNLQERRPTISSSLILAGKRKSPSTMKNAESTAATTTTTTTTTLSSSKKSPSNTSSSGLTNRNATPKSKSPNIVAATTPATVMASPSTISNSNLSTTLSSVPLPTTMQLAFPSLLEERSLKRSRQEKLQYLYNHNKHYNYNRNNDDIHVVPPTHFCGLPIPKKTLGVCGKCGQDGETDQFDTILLCDGEGCGQEFHMKCCTPPLQVVPEGAFYCFDCSQKGSTEQLELYLKQHQEKVESIQDGDMPHSSSLAVIDALLQEDMEKEFRQSAAITTPNAITSASPPAVPTTAPSPMSSSSSLSSPSSTTPSLPTRSNSAAATRTETLSRKQLRQQQQQSHNFPRSELDWIHRHNPTLLIGKPLRLYCPLGNQYHNGRILDIRKPLDCPLYDTVCLVRFPAGKDYRKTPLTTWISLEEHCLAVATKIEWAIITDKVKKNSARSQRATGSGSSSSGSSTKPNASNQQQSKSKYIHGKLWSRTARELVPAIQLLNQHNGQIRFRKPYSQSSQHKELDEETDSYKDDENGNRINEENTNLDMKESLEGPPKWGLVETFGTDVYEFLDLTQETMSIDEPPVLRSFAQDYAEKSMSAALAHVELKEQQRVINWNQKVPLQNPMNHSALRCQDEDALGSLDYQVQNNSGEEQSLVKPSLLIPRGLDRSYIMEMIQQNFGIVPTKDMAIDMTCNLVESLPATIQAITRRDGRGI